MKGSLFELLGKAVEVKDFDEGEVFPEKKQRAKPVNRFNRTRKELADLVGVRKKYKFAVENLPAARTLELRLNQYKWTGLKVRLVGDVFYLDASSMNLP